MIAFLWLLGCPNPGPEADPSIQIVSPADDAVVCGTPLAVELEIENFTLVPVSEGSSPNDGEGHIDLSLNGQEVAMDADESFEISEVEDGLWRLQVELVHADHTSVEPYAGDFIYVTVDNSLCGPQ